MHLVEFRGQNLCLIPFIWFNWWQAFFQIIDSIMFMGVGTCSISPVPLELQCWFMEANTKSRNLGVHLEEQSSAFAQCLTVHSAAPRVRADSYVPKPLLIQGNRGEGKQKSTVTSAGHTVMSNRARSFKYSAFTRQKNITYALLAASQCWRNPNPKHSATEQLPQEQLWCFVASGEQEPPKRYHSVSQDSCKWGKRH